MHSLDADAIWVPAARRACAPEQHDGLAMDGLGV